jgi:hypothetical protein
MTCIFWLPRQELLSWIRASLGWDRFYGALARQLC